MHGLTVEYRSPSCSLSRDLAQQLSRQARGKVVVVAENPNAVLSSTKKQWMRLIRRAQRDRAATLSVITIAGLTQQIAWMLSLRFSAKAPDDLLEADITFATAEDFVRFPPVCPVVYVTYTFNKEKLYMLTSWMPKNGKVVIYE